MPYWLISVITDSGYICLRFILTNFGRKEIVFLFNFINYLDMALNLVQRHQAILKSIHQKKNVSIMGLSSELDVSSVTIRKDIRLLEAKNLVFRKHGRAYLRPGQGAETNARQQNLKFAERARIGRAAAALLREHDSVMLGAGSCLWHLARCIPTDLPLNLVTSSPEISIELLRCPLIETVQLAGSLTRGSRSVAGRYAELGIRDLNFDVLFLEVAGIDILHGVTMAQASEAQLVKQMLNRAKKIVVLIDSEKLGQASFSKVATINQIDHIITDKRAPLHLTDQIRTMGIEVTNV
jgi:DeoR family transcriptional regulator of aga operon